MASRLLSEVRYRLRALLRRDAVEAELDDELTFHLERLTEKLIAAGLPPAEAHRRARLELGGVEITKEEVRAARGVAALDAFLLDLRYAWRGLRSRKAFTAGVVLTLGLGIGANATMFGIVDQLLLRPPPGLRDPERTHRIYVSTVDDGQLDLRRNLQYATYLNLLGSARSFDTLAAFQTRRMAVGEGTDTLEVPVTLASASYFDLFSVAPALGRFYTPAEDAAPRTEAVAVLGYAFWKARFGGRPDVLGQELRVDRVVARIVGVAPEGFVGMADQGVPAVFLPITQWAFAFRGASYTSNYNWSWTEVAGRRRAGADLAAAESDLTRAFWQSWRAAVAAGAGWSPPEEARPAAVLGPVHFGRGPLAAAETKVATLVAGMAVVVLLVACANVANLLLSRSVRRQREIAMRLALGAGRGRLLRQLLVESLLLAALGAVTGLLIAAWGGAGLRLVFLEGQPPLSVLTDARTLLFAAVVAGAAALLTGLVPALHARRLHLAGVLRAGVREESHDRSRVRAGLLVFQATLSVVLLVGAGLFVRSLQNVWGMRLGYDIEPVLFATASPRGVDLDEAEQRALIERMREAARELPGVEHVALAASVPFWSNESQGLWVDGVFVGDRGTFILQAGSEDYFAALGTRVLRGRAFGTADRESAPPVVVVGESMAGALWPGRDPLGQCLHIGDRTAPCTTVVGVAENARLRSLSAADEHTYYVPAAQHPDTLYPQLFVRFAGPAEPHSEALRRRLQAEMPGPAFVSVTPLRDLVDPNLRAWKLGATMFVAFGALALALAGIGLYGMIAYDMAQRRWELAVRLALGASTRDMLRVVVRGALSLVAAGVGIGVAIAFWTAPSLESLLFRASPRDPLVYGGVALTLVAVAIAASAGPARRALALAPSAVLRED